MEFVARHGSCDTWFTAGTAFQNKNNIPTVRRGGSMLVWGCFADSGPRLLAMIDGTMNSSLY